MINHRPDAAANGGARPTSSKSRLVLLALLVLIVLFIVPVGGWFSFVGDRSGMVRAGARPEQRVHYRVGGDATVGDVTFSADGTRDVTVEENAALPWRKTLDVTTSSRTVYQVSVRARDSGVRTVTCEIIVEGKKVVRSRDTRRHAKAACEY